MGDYFLSVTHLLQTWGGLLISGAGVTCKLFAMAWALELIVALTLGLGRLSEVWIVRCLANVIVEIFRGISSFVTLFWLYFALPILGVKLSAIQAAVFALALVHGAYASEYVRSTFLSVPKGQLDAAVALNMTKFQRLRFVMFPQALVAMMPLFGNDAIMLLKASSLASLIAVQELTEAGIAVNVATYSAHAFGVFSILLSIYFVLSQIVAHSMRRLEKKVARWKFPSGVSAVNQVSSK